MCLAAGLIHWLKKWILRAEIDFLICDKSGENYFISAQLAGAVQYTDCISAEG